MPLKKFPNKLRGTLPGFVLHNPPAECERRTHPQLHENKQKLSFPSNCRKQLSPNAFLLSEITAVVCPSRSLLLPVIYCIFSLIVLGADFPNTSTPRTTCMDNTRAVRRGRRWELGVGTRRLIGNRRLSFPNTNEIRCRSLWWGRQTHTCTFTKQTYTASTLCYDPLSLAFISKRRYEIIVSYKFKPHSAAVDQSEITERTTVSFSLFTKA